MKLIQIRDDTRGATLVEMSVTIPLFLLLMFGIVQAGFLLLTQSGLQHGVEKAARCASVNYAANQLKLTQSCFTVAGAAVAPKDVTDTTIQQYAAENSYGIVPPSGSFIITSPADGGVCGTNKGYVVSVKNYPVILINYIFSVKLTTTSCFPITANS